MAVIPSDRLQHRDRMVTAVITASAVPNVFGFQIKKLLRVKCFIHHVGVETFRLARQFLPDESRRVFAVVEARAGAVGRCEK
jgi:hypothetical protein